MHCPSLRIPGRAAGWLTLWGKPKRRSYFLGYEWPKSSILYIAERSHPGALFAPLPLLQTSFLYHSTAWSVDLTHCSFPSQITVDYECQTDIFNFCLSIKPLAIVVKLVERGEIYAQVPSPGPLHIVSKQCVCHVRDHQSCLPEYHMSVFPSQSQSIKVTARLDEGKLLLFLFPMSSFPCFE